MRSTFLRFGMGGRKAYNMVGQQIGRLTVLSRASYLPRYAYWLCSCACGAETIVRGVRLRRGETRSCGCVAADVARIRLTTHGKSRTNTYGVWHNIKDRCLNSNSMGYPNYGARGIFLEFRNQKMTVTQWAATLGIKRNILYKRIYAGWSVERALIEPVYRSH